MASIPELAEPLSDGVVALRLYAERDIPEILIAYQDDPHMHELLGEQRPPSGAQLGRLAEEADADRAAGSRVAFTILEPGADDCRGQVIVDSFNWPDASAEYRVWVALQFRRHGFARRGVQMTAGWLSEACGLTLRCREPRE